MEFSDGSRGTYGMGPLLGPGVFRALRDDGLFASARVSCGVVTWTDEIDTSSERLWADCEPVGGGLETKAAPREYFSRC